MGDDVADELAPILLGLREGFGIWLCNHRLRMNHDLRLLIRLEGHAVRLGILRVRSGSLLRQGGGIVAFLVGSRLRWMSGRGLAHRGLRRIDGTDVVVMARGSRGLPVGRHVVAADSLEHVGVVEVTVGGSRC